MPRTEEHEDPKSPAKQPARAVERGEREDRERDRARHDPFADDHPAICRGID